MFDEYARKEVLLLLLLAYLNSIKVFSVFAKINFLFGFDMCSNDILPIINSFEFQKINCPLSRLMSHFEKMSFTTSTTTNIL